MWRTHPIGLSQGMARLLFRRIAATKRRLQVEMMRRMRKMKCIRRRPVFPQLENLSDLARADVLIIQPVGWLERLKDGGRFIHTLWIGPRLTPDFIPRNNRTFMSQSSSEIGRLQLMHSGLIGTAWRGPMILYLRKSWVNVRTKTSRHSSDFRNIGTKRLLQSFMPLFILDT